MINEAPTIFDTPLTERISDTRPRVSSGPQVGLLLRHNELESVFQKAFLQAGYSVVNLDPRAAIEVDLLWIDLENVGRFTSQASSPRLPSKTLLFLLCDNVHATAEDSRFRDSFFTIPNDIICLPRPAVIQDALHCLSNPDAVESCGGLRIKASERMSKSNGGPASKLHLDGIGQDETKFDTKNPAGAASGMRSPPLVGLTETQSMVAGLPPAKQNKPSASAPVPGSVVLLVDDNIVSATRTTRPP